MNLRSGAGKFTHRMGHRSERYDGLIAAEQRPNFTKPIRAKHPRAEPLRAGKRVHCVVEITRAGGVSIDRKRGVERQSGGGALQQIHGEFRGWNAEKASAHVVVSRET